MMMSMPDGGDAVDLALLLGAPKGGRSPTAGAPSSNAAPVRWLSINTAMRVNMNQPTNDPNQHRGIHHQE